MKHPAHLFVRDWAVIGFVTATLAPLLVGATVLPPLIESGFVATAALLGGLSGAVVGWFFHAVLTRLPEHTWIGMSVVLAMPLMSAWGSATSVGAALLTAPEMVLLAAICGSVSGLVQCTWLAPAYAWLVRGRRPRFAASVVGAAVGGPLCGVACLTVVIGVPSVLYNWF